jgi:hypothetical protein
MITVQVKAVLDVLQPFAPDDSWTTVSAIAGLGGDPLTVT